MNRGPKNPNRKMLLYGPGTGIPDLRKPHSGTLQGLIFPLNMEGRTGSCLRGVIYKESKPGFKLSLENHRRPPFP